MIKLKTSVKGIIPFLKLFSRCNLKQVTKREEMVRWFDGDWGTYWFLFKTPDDGMRIDIVHQRDNTTRFATYFGKRVDGRPTPFFTGEGGMTITTPYIPLDDLIDLCVKSGLKFEDPEFTYADSLYDG